MKSINPNNNNMIDCTFTERKRAQNREAQKSFRRRKQYENQLRNNMNQQFTLDQVGFNTESIQGTL